MNIGRRYYKGKYDHEALGVIGLPAETTITESKDKGTLLVLCNSLDADAKRIGLRFEDHAERAEWSDELNSVVNGNEVQKVWKESAKEGYLDKSSYLNAPSSSMKRMYFAFFEEKGTLVWFKHKLVKPGETKAGSLRILGSMLCLFICKIFQNPL